MNVGMNYLAILVVLAVGYIWMTRGFYSALLHMICVVLAGAVAFAVWEPLAYAILRKNEPGSFMSGIAWAVSLGLPFAVVLAVLRVPLDKLLRPNVKLLPAMDYVGGGVCGAVSGIITSGILVICVGFLRLDTAVLGYQPLEVSSKGAVQHGKGLIFPTDKITAKLYGHASLAAFRTDDPLAVYYPDLHEVPGSLRINYGEGKSRNTTNPDDFAVVARYTVGKDKNLPAPALFKDKDPLSGKENPPQDVKDPEGDAPGTGAYIEGYVVKFNSKAKERGGDGRVTFSNAQVRLLCARQGDESDVKVVYPIAAISQADPLQLQAAQNTGSGTNSNKPTEAKFGRWRFDSKDVFLASVGGGAEAPFAIEFAIPQGYEPRALYIKQVRHMVSEGETAKIAHAFATPDQRDDMVRTSPWELIPGAPRPKSAAGPGAGAAGALDMSQCTIVDNPRENGLQFDGFKASAALGRTISKTVIAPTLEVNDDNKITNGEQTFTPDELKDQALEKNLRVDSFITEPTTVIVQIDVGGDQKATWLGKDLGPDSDNLEPALVDAAGTRYEPIGYILEDGANANYTIRFTPGKSIGRLKDLPTLTRSRPDKLRLVFRVTFGQQVQHFAVGNKAMVQWKNPILLNQTQQGR